MRSDTRRSVVAVLALAALLVPAVALAQSAGPLPAASTTGMLDTIQQVFADSAGGWLTHATAAAQDLFSWLAVLEISWVGIQWALKRPELHELLGSLTLKIMFFAIFYFGVIGMAPDWVPRVLYMFQHAGLIVTGTSAAQAGALTPANPSAIFGESLPAITALESVVRSQLAAFHPLDDVLWGLANVLAAAIFVLAYALLAFEALIINIEASVILGAGVFMLAFAGSSWTTTFSEKYLSYVFSIGVKYFVLTVILVTGVHLPQMIQHVFQTMHADGGGGWTTPIELSFVTLVYGVTGLMAPGIAGSMLSGSPSLSTGSFMGAAVGGAGAAMGAAGAAAGVAGLAGSGGMALAAMAKRLGGGSAVAGGIAGDMGAMGMLGSMAGKNGTAAGSGGGVAGLARSLGPGSSGPAGSIGRGGGSSGPTGGWTVDSAGTARPAQPGASARPAGASGAAAGGPAPNIRFGDRDGGSASRQAGAAGSKAAPGQDRGADSNTGGPAVGGQDGIADPKEVAPGAAAESAGAEKAGKGFFSRTAAQHAANVAKHASRGIGHAQDALRHQGLSGGINIRLNHPE